MSEEIDSSQTKKLKVEPKQFTSLPTVDWEKLQPPEFKRCFIDSSTLSKPFNESNEWLQDIPSSARAFLESTAGSTYLKPTLVQQQAWPELLHGSNIMCVAPTGSGKTLSFLLPGLVVCEEAATRWKRGHKERADMATQKQAQSRTALRFLGYSKDYMSPIRPSVLVLVPTRELAMQVSKQASLVLRTKGLRCALIMGGMDPMKEKKTLEAPTPTHMMVATPGRLIDLLRDRKVDLLSVCLVVIDEADRMLSLGLADQVSIIASQIRPDVQIAVLSATLPDIMFDVASGWASTPLKTIRIGATDLIQTETNSRRTNRVTSDLFNHVQDPKHEENQHIIDIDESRNRSHEDEDIEEEEEEEEEVPKRVTSSLAVSLKVEQQVHVCAPHKKPRKMIKWLLKMKSSHDNMRVIVFCNKISNVGTVTKLLQKNNGSTLGSDCKVVALHGRMPQSDRSSALKSFTKGDVRVMVCTDIAARGLHMPNLTHVLNYDFPSTLELYVHRIGRVGRLGQVSASNNSSDLPSSLGVAYSFFTRNLSPLAPELVKLLKECQQKVDPILQELAETEEATSSSSEEEKETENETKENKFSSSSIASMVDALLQGSVDTGEKSEEDGDDDDDDRSGDGMLPVGYALPPWLQKKETFIKKEKESKANKKGNKKQESKKRSRINEEETASSEKKTKKNLKSESEPSGVPIEISEDKIRMGDGVASVGKREASNTEESIVPLDKKPYVQPFHNQPLHVRLKIAQEMKKDITELEGTKPLSKKELALKAGKRPRGKRGGAKSKKKS